MSKRRYNPNNDEEKLNIFARIYKFFSKYFDELSLFFLAGFLYYVASNTSSGWLYFVVSIIGGLLVLSFLSSFFNIRNIRIHRKYSETNMEDGKVRITLTVINDSIFPKYMLLISDSFPSIYPDEKNEKLLIPLVEGRGKVNISYEQRCYTRGVFKFGKITIESYGLLGFFYMKKKIQATPDRLIVFPKTYRLDHFLLNNVSPYFARQEHTYQVTGRSHDFLGIREYVPGEETRFIHWPTTAKQGKLMIKEFKEIATHSLTVILDTHQHSVFGEGRETTSEDMYRICATLLKISRQKRYTFDLFARFNDIIIKDQNLSSIKGMYRLAQLESESRVPLEQDLYQVAPKLSPLDHIYIFKVLPFTDLESLKEIIAKKVFTTVIFLDPVSYLTELDEEIDKVRQIDYNQQIDMLKSMGIKAYVFKKGQSLNSILSFRRPVNVFPVS